MDTTNKKHGISLSPLKITVIYLIVAALWIAFTDRMLESLVTDAHFLSTLQTYKGLLYVLLTGGGLFWLIKKHDQQIQKKELKLKNLLEEIQSEKELKDILFKRIPILITIYDPDLEKFEVNKEFEKVIGWSNEEIEKEEIDLLKACYPNLETREEAVEFMNSPGVGWKEFDISTKSGQKKPISWTNVRLTDNTSVGIGVDMTEVRASQAKIRESQKLLRKIFESLKSSLIILDYKSRTIIDCNKSTEELFGYSKEELEGKSTRILHVSEEKFEEFNQIGATALEEKGVFRTEFEMQRKDGSTFYSDHTVTLVYDEEDKIDKVVSLVRDITDRKNHEKELRRRKKRLLRSQKIGQIGDWELDIETEDITWSPTMYKIFERDPGLGPPAFKDIQKNYYKEQSEVHNKTIQRAIDEGQSYDIDLPLQTDQENKKYIRAIITPVKGESDNVVKLRGIVQDITERKKAELALNESKERIQNITDNVPGVVFRYILEKDGSDRLEFVSKGAKEIWGISPDKAQEDINSIWENFHPSDIENVQKSVRRSAETLTKWNEEWRYIKPDGSVHWHSGIGIPSKGEDDSIVWDSIILDITEQKRMQQKIIDSVIEGENRERKRIAHELHDGLGQYLVAANMNLESVKKDIQQLSEKKEQQFHTGLSLLKDALSETRSIAYNLMPKAIADYGLVTAVKNLIQNLQKSTDITFHFDYNKEELNLKDQAEINIYRIIQELVSNAVRHADCSAISIKLQVNRNSVKLIIEDDGKGIQLEEKNSNKGLGLRSIKTRVSNLQGTIDITSQPEEGMTTTIIIPYLQSLLK